MDNQGTAYVTEVLLNDYIIPLVQRYIEQVKGIVPELIQISR
jgi:hypothetical protein